MNKFLELSPIASKVLFIDDRSEDDSLALIMNVCRNDKRYSFISLEHNGGLSVALKAGIDHSDSTFIGYIDSDLQTSPSDFLNLLPYSSDYELVMGIRESRKDGWIKRLSSAIANGFRQWLLNDEIADTGCPLKIVNAQFASNIIFFNGMHRFIPNLITILGGRVKQVPVTHYPRMAGRPKYTLLNRLIGPLVDAVFVWWIQRNLIRYRVRTCNDK